MLSGIDDIKKMRRKLGITQAELAVRSGVSQSLIAKMESGKIEPRYSSVVKIFSVLEELEKQEQPKAKELMTKKIAKVQKEESVSKAIALMKKNDLSQIPVFAGQRAVGSISEKTILEKMMNGTDISGLSYMAVGDIMEDSFPLITEETPLNAVIALLENSFAVLVGKNDRTVGIITKSDLLEIV